MTNFRFFSDDQLEQLLSLFDRPVPSDWRAQAACAGEDPELWFPHPTDDATYAKDTCAGCPARDACLVDTIKVEHGIFGGLTEQERARLRSHLTRRRRNQQREVA